MKPLEECSVIAQLALPSHSHKCILRGRLTPQDSLTKKEFSFTNFLSGKSVFEKDKNRTSTLLFALSSHH